MLKAPLNSCIYTYDTKSLLFNKNMTYSGYKKTQVFQQLKKSILKGEVDKACFWAAELDASCYTEDVWVKIMLFACKEINYANQIYRLIYIEVFEILKEFHIVGQKKKCVIVRSCEIDYVNSFVY